MLLLTGLVQSMHCGAVAGGGARCERSPTCWSQRTPVLRPGVQPTSTQPHTNLSNWFNLRWWVKLSAVAWCWGGVVGWWGVGVGCLVPGTPRPATQVRVWRRPSFTCVPGLRKTTLVWWMLPGADRHTSAQPPAAPQTLPTDCSSRHHTVTQHSCFSPPHAQHRGGHGDCTDTLSQQVSELHLLYVEVSEQLSATLWKIVSIHFDSNHWIATHWHIKYPIVNQIFVLRSVPQVILNNFSKRKSTHNHNCTVTNKQSQYMYYEIQHNSNIFQYSNELFIKVTTNGS